MEAGEPLGVDRSQHARRVEARVQHDRASRREAARDDRHAARVTERGTRADDKASEAAMEDRKKAGYF